MTICRSVPISRKACHNLESSQNSRDDNDDSQPTSSIESIEDAIVLAPTAVQKENSDMEGLDGGNRCGCGRGCTAGPAGVLGVIRELGDADAAPVLRRFIRSLGSQVESLEAELSEEQEKNREMESEHSALLSIPQADLLAQQQKNKGMERAHSALLVRGNSHLKKLESSSQEMEILRASLHNAKEEMEILRASLHNAKKEMSEMVCEGQRLGIRLQVIGAQHSVALRDEEESVQKVRVELETAKGQIQQKEHEIALIEEREEEISEVEREHEERKRELQAVKAVMESQLREKVEQERALIKEREEMSKIKREYEQREGQIQAAMADLHSQLREKEESELELKEAKKQIDALKLKLREVRAVVGAESEQTGGVMLEATREEIGQHASMDEASPHDQVDANAMELD